LDLWVGGRTEELGWLIGGSIARQGKMMPVSHPGVRKVVVNWRESFFVENLGGTGTIWKNPFDANQKFGQGILQSNNMYSATYVKVREWLLTYDIQMET